MDLVVCEYVFGEQSFEISKELLVLEAWILQQLHRRLPICRFIIDVIGYSHFLFNHFNWHELVLGELLPHLHLAILKGFVLVKVEEPAELRVVIKGLLELLAPEVIEAGVSNLEEILGRHF